MASACDHKVVVAGESHWETVPSEPIISLAWLGPVLLGGTQAGNVLQLHGPGERTVLTRTPTNGEAESAVRAFELSVTIQISRSCY